MGEITTDQAIELSVRLSIEREELCLEILRLREALEVYADPENWMLEDPAYVDEIFIGGRDSFGTGYSVDGYTLAQKALGHTPEDQQ